jgi:hypothetical protein
MHVIPQQQDRRLGVSSFNGVDEFHVLCMHAPERAWRAFGIEMQHSNESTQLTQDTRHQLETTTLSNGDV